MEKELGDLRGLFDEIISSFEYVDVSEIPNIELYMDQVLTFMDRHLAPYARDPENDKILTKTMINNYTKNHLLAPPVRKKYDIDHMLMLLIIYYMKSFLSISDIGEILKPVREKYVEPFSGRKNVVISRKNPRGNLGGGEEGSGSGSSESEGAESKVLKEGEVTMRDVYAELYESLIDELENVVKQTNDQFSAAERSFAEFPEKDRQQLQRLDLISRMSAEIYIKKLFIERMLDSRMYSDPQ